MPQTSVKNVGALCRVRCVTACPHRWHAIDSSLTSGCCSICSVLHNRNASAVGHHAIHILSGCQVTRHAMYTSMTAASAWQQATMPATDSIHIAASFRTQILDSMHNEGHIRCSISVLADTQPWNARALAHCNAGVPAPGALWHRARLQPAHRRVRERQGEVNICAAP